ncbi:MAG: hypothetical protein JO040_05140 [Gemmatimonadetes bacterium]|nr:hypothetical protein [Gemmatimonadota bacterium]
MPLTDLMGGSSGPAVRRPVFEVAFGGGGGGLGGLAGAAAALGGGGDPWKASLVSVTVECGLAPFADVAEIELSPDPQAPTVALGDEGSISLGYEDDDAATVFTGKVAAVRRRVGGTTRVTVTNGGAELSRLRVNQGYEGENSGGVVGELAGLAGVDTDTVEDGIDFPYYVVDDRTGGWGHVARLARLSGYLAYLTPDGALYFGPYNEGDPVRTFAYGADLLALEVTEAAPVVTAVTAVGEGAAGSQGEDAWGWLLRDAAAVTRDGGEGDTVRLLTDGALRSGDAAQQAAEGVVTAAGRLALTGRLLAPGAPEVTVGSTVAVSDAPQDALNGSFLVRRVRHRFSKREGFTTLVDFATGGGGGGLGGFL